MADTDLDILVSRVIDGRAGSSDWSALEARASADAGVWKELALAQRDHAVLTAAVRRETAKAEAVRLPRAAEPVQAEIPPTFAFPKTVSVAARARSVGTWAGWAAAAAMALAFVGRGTVPMLGGSEGVRAGLTSQIESAADLFNRYLDTGKKAGTVVGETPDRKIIDVVPAADGHGYDIFYLRGVVEKQRVDNLYRFTTDETGQQAPVQLVPEQAPRKFRKPAV